MTEQYIKDDFFVIPKYKDIGRYYVTKFVINIAAKLPNGTIILDAGAGECA